MRQWPENRIAFGGDYNPEQWPREVWADDLRLMAEAGVSFVTLGVFSWSWLEPSKGEYTFDWLDDIMDLLGEHGIAVDLATATATPPPWLTSAYPEILPVDREGHTLWPGSRQSWCPSSPLYREFALALTDRLASRYHDHPALAMWHVSNEYACHNLPCYCDTCAVAFRRWLEQRHGTLDASTTPGARPSGASATSWDDISRRASRRRSRTRPTCSTTRASAPTPARLLPQRVRGHPPALHRADHDELHDDEPVPLLDYHDWAPHQDVVSTDHYVVNSLEHPQAELSFHGDLTRGLAGGRPWMLMEHSTSAVNWQPVNPAKVPGGTILDSLAHVARGADTLGFFQWRQSRSGSEKFHSALVPHAGEDSDRFREVCELGAIADRLGEVLGSRVDADVAVLWDYEALWAMSGPCMPSSAIDYATAGHTIHRLLRDRGVTCDVVHPSADLSRYRVVVVPTLYLVSDEDAASIAAAAAAGAHVVVTYFSGISDANDHVRLGGYPGAFRDLLGVRVEEFFPLREQEGVALSDGGTGSQWSEDATATDAQVVTTYANGPLAGRPAVTRRDVDAGVAWYLGTLPDDASLGSLLDTVLRESGVESVVRTSPGVEVVRRRSDSGSWLFVLNHTDDACQVTASGHDLVSSTDVGPTLHLSPRTAAVVREG
jgi:beta-galactosidase